MAKILVVDDDQGMREFMEIMLVQEGYDVTSIGEPVKAIDLCRENAFDLIITDLKMPKISGIDFLKVIKDQRPDAIVILITGYASGETAIKAMKEGAYDYVEKGGSIEELKKVVRSALQKKGLIENNIDEEKLRTDIETSCCSMIGTNREMIKIFATIKKVSDTLANILILGESGTGKELVASAIHENSSRLKKPFVAINSGGIPENLLESELFGYMKGSFTGAYADKAGFFEMARGGTIFLDEIGELSPSLQVKLLRVLQEKTFERVGSNSPITVDIRVIAATNVDLEREVRDGNFREDLYYRLKVVPVELPPLRERKADIPVLVSHFLQMHCRNLGRPVLKISKEAVDSLMSYSWPGNIRELENFIERLVVLAKNGDELKSEDLPVGMFYSAAGDGEDGAEGENFREALRGFERRFIIKELARTNWNRVEAARRMNMHRNTLLAKMKELNIKEPRY